MVFSVLVMLLQLLTLLLQTMKLQSFAKLTQKLILPRSSCYSLLVLWEPWKLQELLQPQLRLFDQPDLLISCSRCCRCAADYHMKLLLTSCKLQAATVAL